MKKLPLKTINIDLPKWLHPYISGDQKSTQRFRKDTIEIGSCLKLYRAYPYIFLKY